MKFSTREDIEAPIEHVWAHVRHFKKFERQLLRRGAEVTRVDALGKPGVGSEWEINFTFRGKPRDIEAKIVEFDAPNTMKIDSHSGGLDGHIVVDLMSLSPRRTRMQLSVELVPQNLTARLLVQSLKFARGNLNKRFSDRIYDFAQDVEARYTNAV